MMPRPTVAKLEFADDLLLYRQPAGDRIELTPPFEDKAVDKLLMVETGTGPAPRAAPGLHRRRLPSGARAICRVRQSRYSRVLRRAPIAFASGLKRRTSIMIHPPGFAIR